MVDVITVLYVRVLNSSVENIKFKIERLNLIKTIVSDQNFGSSGHGSVASRFSVFFFHSYSGVHTLLCKVSFPWFKIFQVEEFKDGFF